MKKNISIKLVLFILLIGLFVIQNIVLISPLSVFVTQPPLDGIFCQEYAQKLDVRYSNSINTAFIIGIVSLSVSLVFIYFAKVGKDSRKT